KQASFFPLNHASQPLAQAKSQSADPPRGYGKTEGPLRGPPKSASWRPRRNDDHMSLKALAIPTCNEATVALWFCHKTTVLRLTLVWPCQPHVSGISSNYIWKR